jgi:hypothetical protein
MDARSFALAASFARANKAIVAIGKSHAAGFEAATQGYDLGSLAAALAKSGFPARCRLK